MKGIYVVKDTVLDEFVMAYIGNNDKIACRMMYASVGAFAPIKDLQLMKIGEIDEDKKKIKNTEWTDIAWDIYEFPQTKAECLAPNGSTEEQIKAFEDACKENDKKEE